MKVINYLGIVFAACLVLQFSTSFTGGHQYNNGILTTLWLSFLAGVIGFLAVNIYAIVNSSGANLAADEENMKKGFFFSLLTAGILLSIQATLTHKGSHLVFIPQWIKVIIYTAVGVGVVAWIVCAAFFAIAKGITAFKDWVSTDYRWLIVAGILAGIIALFVVFNDTSFALSKEDALFQFDKPNNPSGSTGTKGEKAELEQLIKKYKTGRGTSKEKLADIKEMLRLAKKYDDGTNAEKIADLERMIALLEKYQDAGEPLADNGTGKQPAEAEQYKETEQIIRDGNGVTVSQKRNADGSVEQHIDADEPDGQ